MSERLAATGVTHAARAGKPFSALKMRHNQAIATAVAARES
jgi:hypothetical protein